MYNLKDSSEIERLLTSTNPPPDPNNISLPTWEQTKCSVRENGHIIEAERDEAVIVAEAFNNSEIHCIEGTLSQIASALNVIGGGKNFDDGAKIIDNKKTNELLKSKKQEKDTDVDSIITPSSIIINRRSMADTKKYRVTGTTKQIASSINSIDENGVVIEEGGKIEQIN